NGTLAISLAESPSTGNVLDPIHESSSRGKANPVVGVSGHLHLNTSARLSVPILGSIRTVRDFTEGPSLLRPEIQDAIKYTESPEGGRVSLSRLWLDNSTTTTLSFAPTASNASVTLEDGDELRFQPGTYSFNASFNYPQLQQLSPREVL